MVGCLRLTLLLKSGADSPESSENPSSKLFRFLPDRNPLATAASVGRQTPPNELFFLSFSTSPSQRLSRTTISRLKISDLVSGSMSRLSNKTNFFDPLRFLETLFGPEAKSLRQLNASSFPLRLSLPEPVWSTSGLINLGRPRFPFTGLLTAGLSRI